MSKLDDKFQKLAEAREAKRSGRQEEAAETVRLILKPTEVNTSHPTSGNEKSITVEFYNSTLLWPDTVGAKTVELIFLTSDDRSAAIPLIELVFSLDTEARTRLYRILSDSEKRRYLLRPTQRGVYQRPNT